ncbi:MAG: hypothetical protein J0I29_05225 [Rhizobiales bacterium]|nr:hypothetical protein [Hyphomicrobiales bacterium]
MQIKSSCLAMAFLLAAGDAFAQAPPTPKTPAPETAPPNIGRNGAQNCTPTQAMPNDGTIAPRDNTTTGQSTETLGDKLAKSDGVLCPPSNVDPQMHAPAPNVGKMPVIPPPGSPGGDPTVRPK